MKAAKKKAAPKARTTRHEPPAGLVAAFTMVNKDNSTMTAARSTASTVYPHAVRVIEVLQGRRRSSEHQDVALDRELDRAAHLIHRGGWDEDDITDNGNIRSETSFDVGFAVCWLLMTSVNGGGAR